MTNYDLDRLIAIRTCSNSGLHAAASSRRTSVECHKEAVHVSYTRHLEAREKVSGSVLSYRWKALTRAQASCFVCISAPDARLLIQATVSWRLRGTPEPAARIASESSWLNHQAPADAGSRKLRHLPSSTAKTWSQQPNTVVVTAIEIVRDSTASRLNRQLL